MEKPQKNLADYLALAISPVLIMLLVGSLEFFLTLVFYRGEMIHEVCWTLFWFVIAIVLISRIGIQRGKRSAWLYGAALAMVAWIYLAYSHQPLVVGALLLAITWWCAHELTVDCTWVGEDLAREGTFQKLLHALEKQFTPPEPRHPPLSPLELLAAANLARRRASAPYQPRGRSVVGFSLAALPLFGIGQLFLPADELHMRQDGFAFLALYLAAAFGLLITTSILTLRGHLRRSAVEIPASVTTAWIRFGGLLTSVVLLAALLLPRPGGLNVWKNLTYRIPRPEHKASDYALPFNPPGQGDGQRADQTVEQTKSAADSKRMPPGNAIGHVLNDRPATSDPRSQPEQPDQANQPGMVGGGGPGDQEPSGPGDSAKDTRPAASLTIPTKSVIRSENPEQPSSDQPPSRTDLPQTEIKPLAGAQTKPLMGLNPPLPQNWLRPGANDQRPFALPTIPLKDINPSGNSEPIAANQPSIGNDGTSLPDRDGPDQPLPRVKLDHDLSRPGKDLPQQETRPLQPLSVQTKTVAQPNQPPIRNPGPREPGDFHHHWLRSLLVLVLTTVLVWLLVRFRQPIGERIRKLLAAGRGFLRKLFRFGRSQPAVSVGDGLDSAGAAEPLTAYENPFATGQEKLWARDRLLRYTFQAMQAWAQAHGIVKQPQQTPREFCGRLIEQFPHIGPELEEFSRYCSHAAFARRLPDDFETESIRRLWQYLGNPVMV
jgi:hypothetical protein